MKPTVILLGLLFALADAPFARAQSPVPATLNFQGRLAKPDGTPLPDTAAQSLTFSLYDAATGGNLLWTQTSGNIAVHNGVFSAKLNFAAGFQNGNTLQSAFANPLITPRLQIQVGADAPLTPRQSFASSAYSFVAATALTVPDSSLTSAKFAGGVLVPGGAAGGDLTGAYPNPLLASLPASLAKVSGGAVTTDGKAVTIGGPPSGYPLYILNSSAAPTVKIEQYGSNLLIGPLSAGGSATVVQNTAGNLLFNPGGGSVGIGTTAPDHALTVAGNAAFTTNANTGIQVTGSNALASLAVQQNGGGNAINAVSNSSLSTLLLYNSGGGRSLTATGDMQIYGVGYASGGFFSSSDARFKTDILPLDDALAKVLSLRGVSYQFDRKTWTERRFPEGRQIGFIAQDVEKIFPELVTTDREGYKSVAYQNAVPVLVEALKTLKSQMDDQKREIAELKKQNAALNELAAEISELKRQIAKKP